MEARKDEEPRKLGVYDTKRRTLIDGELTEKSIDFMQRQVKAGKPFFLFIPYTQTHMPVTPHPEFAGITKNGDFADVLAQTDAYVGRLLDEVDKLGIRDSTVFIFTADNGPDPTLPHHSFPGPWGVATSPDSRDRCVCRSSSAGPAAYGWRRQ